MNPKKPKDITSASALRDLIFDARKQKPPVKWAGSLLIYRGRANAWVMGWHGRGKYHTEAYQNCPALYWYPLPPWDNLEVLKKNLTGG